MDVVDTPSDAPAPPLPEGQPAFWIEERARAVDERAKINDERARLNDERARDLRQPDADKPDGKDGKSGDEGRPDDTSKQDRSGKDDDEAPGLFARLRGWAGTHKLLVVIGLVALIALIVAGVLWYLSARHFETTDDAFIDARSYSMAPRVSGYVTAVPVNDNQDVPAGAVIARIDDRDYRASLAQANAQVDAGRAGIANVDAQLGAQTSNIQRAQAQVGQTQAALQFAQQEASRSTQLAQTGNGTVQQAQQTQSNLRQAQANLTASQQTVDQAQSQVAVLQAQRASAIATLAQAQAQRDAAELNLSYTVVTAAQAGRVTRLTAAPGQYAQPGSALAMFVPDEIWVTANFKETQITDMRPGQPVDLWVDAYPGRPLQGHVESIQAGSGTAFSLLPAENATGNYVKVVQRMPVKLVFDHPPTDVVLGPGMSVVPKVRVR